MGVVDDDAAARGVRLRFVQDASHASSSWRVAQPELAALADASLEDLAPLLGRRDAEDLVLLSPLAELVPPELEDASSVPREEKRRRKNLGDDGERSRRELEPDRREGRRRRAALADLMKVDGNNESRRARQGKAAPK